MYCHRREGWNSTRERPDDPFCMRYCSKIPRGVGNLMFTPHPEQRWSRSASVSSSVNCLIFWRAPRVIYYWEDFNCILENTDSTDGLQLQPSISRIGALPNINRHMAGPPHTQSLHPLFCVRSNLDWPNIRHTGTTREDTGYWDSRSTIYWPPCGVPTHIYCFTNHADGMWIMENG